MKTLTELVPGIFHELGGLYLLSTESIQEGRTLTKGQQLSLTCMFDIYFALLDGQRVGMFFAPHFEVENGGAYLLTYLRNKGVATEHETLIKDENLVVYHYPNKGTLAVSPKVNQEIDHIFQEQ